MSLTDGTCYRCAKPTLCFSDAAGQIYVNPTSSLAVKASCSISDGSNCKPELRHKWEISGKDAGGNDVPVAPNLLEAHSSTGLAQVDLGMKASFFTSGLVGDFFKLSLTATNGDDADGNLSFVWPHV